MKVMLKMKIPVKLNKQKLVLVGLYFLWFLPAIFRGDWKWF